MGRIARDKRPYVRPVQSIDVQEKHFTLRVVLFIVFVAVAIAAFAYGISTLFKDDQSGWRVILAESDAVVDCSDEFTLQYEIGKAGLPARTEYNQLAAFYGEIAAKAYQLFHETQLFDGIYNVAYLNANPNQTVEVDPVLYEALTRMDAVQPRQLFLAPVYEYYQVLFLCTEDWEIRDYDPRLNGALAEHFTEILAYANDPQAITLELQGNNRVCLRVSAEYLDFAARNDIYTFFGFHWLKNAFIIDYMASTLLENGYTRGSISSYDGFCRNLDDRGISYSYNLFDRIGNGIYCTGTLQYTQRRSIVSLRTFPVNSDDNDRYYVLQNGETRFPYLDMTDGLCRAAQSNLVCYSDGENVGCADILLQVLPLYITDRFDPDALGALREGTGKIESVYCLDGVIWYTEEAPEITDVLQLSSDVYTVRRVGKFEK